MPLSQELGRAILNNNLASITAENLGENREDWNEAFLSAARMGHTEVLSHLIDLTPNLHARQKMIHVENDLAFVLAVSQENFEFANRLISITPSAEEILETSGSEATETDRLSRSGIGLDPEALQKMIHVDEEIAFISAAQRGNFQFASRLIALTADPEAIQKMIHRKVDVAYKLSVARQDLEFSNYLIELTPDPERLRAMFLSHIQGFNSAQATKFLAVILSDEVPGLPTVFAREVGEVENLKDLRVQLMQQESNQRRFALNGAQDLGASLSSADLLPMQMANAAIATLLSRNNLALAKRGEEVTFPRLSESQQRIANVEVQAMLNAQREEFPSSSTTSSIGAAFNRPVRTRNGGLN